MFNKYETITVLTRVENGDNLKVMQLIESYKKSNAELDVTINKCGIVSIEFETLKSLKKQLQHDIAVLNIVGIVAGIED